MAKTIVDVNKLLDAAKRFTPEFPDDAQVTRFADIRFDPAKLNYVVKGLLDVGDMAVFYGGPGSGKTFMTLDMMLSIAAGKTWCGSRVRRGFVLYVGAENPASIAKRVVAWREYHGMQDDPLPFALMQASVDLLTDDSVQQIVECIKIGQSEFKLNLAVCAIDTLSQATAGANENSPEDMTRVVAAMRRIRQTTGAATVAVHHCGKNAANGARGHSSLLGAVDAELEVSEVDGGGGARIARVTKARDAAIGTTFGFNLEVVSLGEDAEGDDVRTCVFVPTDVRIVSKKAAVSKSARAAFLALKEVIAEKGEAMPGTSAIPAGVRAVTVQAWKDRFRYLSATVMDGKEPEKAEEAFRKRFDRAADVLQNDGSIGVAGKYVWIAR